MKHQTTIEERRKAPGQRVSCLCLARGDERPLGYAACSEGLKNTDNESMTPEVVIAKQNS